MPRSTYATLIVALATGAALATSVAVVAQAPVETPSAVATTPATAATAKSASVEVAASIATDLHGMVGVGSCAASGCHGGSKPLPGVGPYDNAAWRSSYVVWATSDPHARAYQTLSGSAAGAIVRKLDRLPAGAKVSPERDRRCTTCHAGANPTDPAVSALAADGIGCESCHGAAKKWLGEHFLMRSDDPSYSRQDVLNERNRLQKLGMIDTDDLRVQAQTCVRCHVGDRSGPDGVRDMNHDMIAAGHPALNFEFAAYKARMPRHWSPTDAAQRAEQEAASYKVGQHVAAAAALRLSADRAAASLDAQPNQPHAPWPEFSEYACFRCHHALRSGPTAEATAQQQFALDRKTTTKAPIGAELWGSWNVWHLSHLSLAKKEGEPSDLEKLQRQASNPFLPETELRGLIEGHRKIVSTLDVLTQIYAQRSDDDAKSKEATAVRWLTEIATKTAAGPLTWDEATQGYLGCVAMYRARRLAANLPLTADDEAGKLLKQLYQALRFDQPGDRKFNSPANYDRAAIKSLFEKLATAAKGGS